jgi:hypothetical protein
LGGSNPKIPPDGDDEWDDTRPTDIRVHELGGPSSEPKGRSADETDEYPVMLARDALGDEALPDFLEARLEVLDGPNITRRFDLTRVRTVIGRGHGSHLRVHDTKMSKKHASIIYAGSEFRIHDEGSTNGTFLNGSRVVEYAIRDGDKLLVGDSILRFRVAGVIAR